MFALTQGKKGITMPLVYFADLTEVQANTPGIIRVYKNVDTAST